MGQVEHWWNGKTAGMARRDLFLDHDPETGWSVRAMWWKDQSRTEHFGHAGGEARARMWITQLRELVDREFPGYVWSDLDANRPRRPERRSGPPGREVQPEQQRRQGDQRGQGR